MMDSEIRVSRAKSISLSLFVAAPVDNKMGLPKEEIERSKEHLGDLPMQFCVSSQVDQVLLKYQYQMQ